MTEHEKLRYRERIKAMTRAFGVSSPQDYLPLSGEFLIVVCPGDSLQIGFDLARKRLAYGARVRLCGHGITLCNEWPGWVYDRLEGQLLLTELGVYSPEARITPWNAAIRSALRKWLSLVMSGMFNDVKSEEVLLSSFVSRIVSLDNDSSRYMGLGQMHPNALIEYTSPNWEGALIVRFLTEKQRQSIWGTIRFNSAIGLGVLLASAVAIYRAIQEYLNSRGNYDSLEKLRKHYAGPEPSIWFVVMPSNLRMNLQLNQLIARRGNRSIGLLMMGSLAPVLQRDSDLKTEPAKKFLEGLGAVSDELVCYKLDQISRVGSVGELFHVIRKFIEIVPKLVIAVMGRGYLLYVGKDIHLNFNYYLLPLIRLLTMDVLRALMGYQATTSFLRREKIAGKKIVFASAVSPDVAVASSIFGRNQAYCVEYLHGVGAAASEATQIKCRWDFSEILDSKILGEHVMFATSSLCVAVAPTRKPDLNAANILFLSNYVHRDSGYKMPFYCFQEQMLSVVPHLLNTNLIKAVRWRPHPADDRALVMNTAKKYSLIELSLDRPLEQDFEWAEIVVSSYSTVISQALLKNLPVFVHLIPELQDISITKFLSPKRTYFSAEELISRLLEFNQSDKKFEPEELAKKTLWGSRKSPNDFYEELEGFCARL